MVQLQKWWHGLQLSLNSQLRVILTFLRSGFQEEAVATSTSKKQRGQAEDYKNEEKTFSICGQFLVGQREAWVCTIKFCFEVLGVEEVTSLKNFFFGGNWPNFVVVIIRDFLQFYFSFTGGNPDHDMTSSWLLLNWKRRTYLLSRVSAIVSFNSKASLLSRGNSSIVLLRVSICQKHDKNKAKMAYFLLMTCNKCWTLECKTWNNTFGNVLSLGMYFLKELSKKPQMLNASITSKQGYFNVRLNINSILVVSRILETCESRATLAK